MNSRREWEKCEKIIQSDEINSVFFFFRFFFFYYAIIFVCPTDNQHSRQHLKPSLINFIPQISPTVEPYINITPPNLCSKAVSAEIINNIGNWLSLSLHGLT
jgi:hypothetical protein